MRSRRREPGRTAGPGAWALGGGFFAFLLLVSAPLAASDETAPSPAPVWSWNGLITIPPDQTAAQFEAYRGLEGQPIARVDVTGNSITKDHVIRRELASKVGGPFAVNTLLADTERLNDLDIFGSVTADVRPESTGVAVGIAVTEMPWVIPYIALKITDEDGFVIGPAVSSLNLFGRDIATSGRILFGGSTTYSLRFTWPWIAANHLSFDSYAAHLIRDDGVRGFEETSTEVTNWVGTYLGRIGRASAGFSYFRMESDTDGITLDPDDADDLFRLGAVLGMDSRDSKRDPRRGWENEIQVWKTGGWLGGDGDFTTADLDIRRYQPLGARSALLLSNLTSLQSGELGADVPVYLDYLMGGSNSIRGHQVDELGKELYGKNQWLVTLEMQRNILPVREVVVIKWPVTIGLQAALFADGGIAWSESEDLTMRRVKTGFGIGLRPLLPSIGMLRLDLAVSAEGVRFNLATQTKPEAQRQRIR